MRRSLSVVDRLALLGAGILAFLFLAGCASMTPEERWAIGLSAADIATTAYALDQGAEELNPILTAGNPSNEEVIARAVALNVALHFLLRHWLSNPERGHDRRGWRIVVGVRTAPVVWNATQIARGLD